MRYYLYLDRYFLRTLFSVLSDLDINIEVIEYSIRKSSTVNNHVSASPYNESASDSERGKSREEKSVQKRYRNAILSKKGIRGDIESSNISTVETQKRYINIEDITEMKNTNFYHSLVEKICNNNYLLDTRIYIDIGNIELNNTDILNCNKDSNGIFLLNGKYIWYDKSILKTDIEILAKMECEVKVVGYVISSLKKEKKAIKAIAIYIE